MKVINSLEEYIKYINNVIPNKYSMNKYYMRGENREYESILASAFRKQTDFVEGMEIYYRSIGNDLNKTEKENFQFYSQHHGLSTPLVDTTTSPLTALFFACENSTDEGYVHFFEQENIPDVSNYLLGGKYNLNLLELIKDRNPSFIYELANGMNRQFNGIEGLSYPFLELLKKLAYKNRIMAHLSEDTRFVGLVDYLTNKNFSDISDIEALLSQSFISDELSKLKAEISSSASHLGIVLSYEYLDKYLVYLDLYCHLLNCFFPEGELPPLPLVKARSSVSFDRMKTQSGMFIYQFGFMHKGNGTIHFNKIKPDFTILIKNSKEIKHQLDVIGINRMSLFPDSDNIANYINQKLEDYYHSPSVYE